MPSFGDELRVVKAMIWTSTEVHRNIIHWLKSIARAVIYGLGALTETPFIMHIS